MENNMEAFEVTLEGEKVMVPSEIYAEVKPMAKVLYGMTRQNDNRNIRKRQASWALNRAISLVRQIQWEVKSNGL